VDELTYRRIGDDASGDRYVLRDGNNNVIALTDADQHIRTQYSYEPYGQTTQCGDDDVRGSILRGRMMGRSCINIGSGITARKPDGSSAKTR
jgi:hypothetical protein